MNFIENISSFQNIIYIASSILFITGIKMLGKEDTAVKGNFLSAFAMFIAVSITLINVINPLLILIGIGIGAIIGSLIALKVKMTSIPEMVALFNGFGGLATFFIAWSEFNSLPANTFQYVLIMITTFIGGVTFSGSVIAYGKLSERLKVDKSSIITKIFTTIFYISLIYLIYSIVIAQIFTPSFDFYSILLILTLLGGIGFVIPIIDDDKILNIKNIGTKILKAKSNEFKFNLFNKTVPFDETELIRELPFEKNQMSLHIKTFNSLHAVGPIKVIDQKEIIFRKSISMFLLK